MLSVLLWCAICATFNAMLRLYREQYDVRDGLLDVDDVLTPCMHRNLVQEPAFKYVAEQMSSEKK